ncbi:DJ-1/PfpI family protein [Pseudoalteromonas luteoviolacea]|uniref:Thimanine synthesis protein ThiJ n=1 Tax=Pseudoalteromonas luteoviolacea H33 TaxID=1365251 RepID=A0A167FUW7_9GAMM|nr:DJ-1/PfpI family protein [Pseudoalteromonas luteoviolacea]KZN53016.1 thimanine synthesis protein ThiJ [Pseudoalteromonas luteoviolacea H33]KZN78067.1 thimanine synthesis protein ThiJ [Pseudoalteromonas luteoviolacea H33-S]MBQ4875696.1 DJ-1/PfpI family protein [Pseudoalteromonas luteoviolacea]MBQ4904731.1 DJ-1/PfpI family protein [Pseudoalteromonas luteoviolacea]
MYKVGVVLFDDFTDVDFFLMYDLLGRTSDSWTVSILGTNPEHSSQLGITVKTDGHISEVESKDVVLLTSGKRGIPAAIKDAEFMSELVLDPTKQLIGSICAGAFILYELGLLKDKPLTTNPDAKPTLQSMGGDVQDLPLVINGNIATAGGCLSLVYLIGWLAERLFDANKRRNIQNQLIPAGQFAIFEDLIATTIHSAELANEQNSALRETHSA